jgi:S-adenosylmethionine:tRNA ribosyltransferase-isomerase
LKTSDFYFDLPEELIAQTPLEDRSNSRLMVLDKESGEIQHRVFKDIIEYLNPGDCLVLNNTRVIPARLIGEKVDTGGKIEFLLLKRTEKDVWQALVKPGKRAKIGTKFSFGNGKLIGEVVGLAEEGSRLVKFYYEGIFEEVLDELGNMPLPPYITERLEERERYQTVYSKHNGSAAAPTAGLHFTEELLNDIKAKGIEIAFVTLHVGLGTFRPVKVDNVLEHDMHSEYYIVEKSEAEKINNAKKNGNRVICVGTTSCRTVESAANENGEIVASEGWTNIFIYPGYKFKIVDRLITNFHLPESTLIMLVSALSSKDIVLNAYNTAVKEQYRASMIPNSIGGQVNSADVMYAYNKMSPTYYKMSIKEEYARIIDDWFSRFGYKINRVKVPNQSGRLYWNYVKIGSGENIGYSTNPTRSVPSSSMEVINNIYRSGVTIWHNHNNIGNYALNNTIV